MDKLCAYCQQTMKLIEVGKSYFYVCRNNMCVIYVQTLNLDYRQRYALNQKGEEFEYKEMLPGTESYY